MTKEEVKTAQELLQERYSIMNMESATEADRLYYNGMVALLKRLGYQTLITEQDMVLILHM